MDAVTRRITVACAAMAAALAPAASAAVDPPRKLFAYGDSLAIGTKPYLPEALPNWRIGHDVDYNRGIRGTARALRARGDRLPPVVHISVGTVDDPKRRARFRRGVRRTLRAVGAKRCVVWANIYRPVRRDDGEIVNGWRPLNKVLARESVRRDNLVVVHWAAMVRRHPDWRSSYDGTHVDERGYRARARAIARDARVCHERLRRRGTS